ncbi:MAG: hypothetical protein QOI10_2160 [Solirubrobacterales bacterium]|jgi:hypothetical protein|nr:hypothetical protein [Solirubrobacterales bacterium]
MMTMMPGRTIVVATGSAGASAASKGIPFLGSNRSIAPYPLEWPECVTGPP